MQFKIGNVYVEDETKAVYVLVVDPYKDNWLDFDQINIPLVSSSYSISLIDQCIYKLVDNPDFNVHDNSDQFVKKKDANVKFRPWQTSNEPDAYEAERWGDIEVGNVYKSSNRVSNFIIITGFSDVTMNGFTYNSVSRYFDAFRQNTKEWDLKQAITRPAFPHEIEGLKLPQMQGAILEK